MNDERVAWMVAAFAVLVIAARVAWPFWCAARCESGDGTAIWTGVLEVVCAEGP